MSAANGESIGEWNDCNVNDNATVTQVTYSSPSVMTVMIDLSVSGISIGE